jgi:iron complex outermembrane receptor protein
MKKFLVLVFLSVASSVSAFADSSDVNLGEIVVTPYRYEEAVGKTAASVATITSQDIINSNAHNVVDALRSVSGVGVRDYFGNGAQSTVDIGGFGEQAALNVLVLVDGRRVNNVDLSGVDWSQIPLDEVDRIEIIRGGSGAVLYGDNASSGVINIITKKGAGSPKVDLETEYGSYDMNKEKVALSGKTDSKLSYLFSAGRDGINGYRDNNFDKDTDFASKIAYDFSDSSSAHFDSGFHASTYGLPGALYQSDIDQYGRTRANHIKDHSNNKDYYFLTGSKSKLSDLGEFSIDFSYRQKYTDSYFLSSGLDTERNETETFGVTPKYTLGNSFLNHDNKFIAGLDFYRSLYTSKTYLPSDDSGLNQYSDINKNLLGSYLQDEFSIFKQLALVCGYRHEFADYTFAYHDNDLHGYGANPDLNNTRKLNTEAFNSGLTYTYKEDSNIFLSAARSFRFPEVDEFTFLDQNYQQQLNTNLKEQSSLDYQVGVRHKFFDGVKGSLSLFRMNIENELYYNAEDALVYGFWNGKNENYGRTTHEGIESSLDVKLNDLAAVFANYTFTDAYFDGGRYNENKIPLVPQNKGSVGLRFSFSKKVTFNMADTYVGERYFLNDQANAYSRLKAYMVADTNLSWSCKDFTVAIGANNIFNKQYSEFAGVSVDSGAKFYYPNPGRNFTLKTKLSF